MSSSAPAAEPRATSVDVSDDELIVTLDDGRRIAAPLAWYPRLLDASEEARANFRLIGGGLGIHWPEIDEDLSVQGLLGGHRSTERSRE